MKTSAEKAGLPLVGSADLYASAARINEALALYVGWRSNAARGADAATIRDWFSDPQTLACALMQALGLDRHASGNAKFSDAMRHLQSAWPNQIGDSEGKAPMSSDLEELVRLAQLAYPEWYAQASREGASEPGREALMKALGERLPAILAALALLTERGAAIYGGRVRPGRKRGGNRDRDEASAHLFAALVEEYLQLFGVDLRIANTANETGGSSRPTGPGVRWLTHLWTVVTKRLQQLPLALEMHDLAKLARDAAKKPDMVVSRVRAAKPRRRHEHK